MDWLRRFRTMFAMSLSCFPPSDGIAVLEHEMPQWEWGKTNQSVLTNLRLLFLVSTGYSSIIAAWLSKLECSPGLGEPGPLFCHTLGGDGCTSQGRRKEKSKCMGSTFSLLDARHLLSYLILTTTVSLCQFTVEGLRLSEGQQCVNTANKNRDSIVDQFGQSIKQKMTAGWH